MYVEMICNCEASFSIDSDGENSESVWHLTWRFANAHVRCGFVTLGASSEVEEAPAQARKRVVKPKKTKELEIEEEE